ncbi:PREDICTED: uncharacterized protein LOC108804043 [Nanorana parkeri]|uniref:uncharacterized protein LOC108804043 n=1 Tax=Nanorana parkeri TaxID=125878 RepID=UPI000854EB76|nr:PREDICTED: uncharacterized protein LOC108804043 [Nanorana parkeri]
MRHNKDQNVTAPAATEGQSSLSHVTAHNQCALMVRLPSGQSLRLGFPADSSLRCVCDHLNTLQPSLSPCSLLQTFPTRHFTEEDLPRSLEDLGLTPNATLCVRPREDPKTSPGPPSPPPQEPLDMHYNLNDLMRHGDDLLPILSSPAQSVSPNVQMREEPMPHSWGRGHRLAPQDEDGAEEGQRFGLDGNLFYEEPETRFPEPASDVS